MHVSSKEIDVADLLHDFIGEVTPAVRKDCYEAFKVAAGSDVRTILEGYQKLQAMRDGMRQKAKDRKVEFKKASGKLTELVRARIITTYLNFLTLCGKYRWTASRRCMGSAGYLPSWAITSTPTLG